MWFGNSRRCCRLDGGGDCDQGNREWGQECNFKLMQVALDFVYDALEKDVNEDKTKGNEDET